MNNTAKSVIEMAKRYFFVVALMGMVIGFSAFRFVTLQETPENGWYELQFIDDELEEPDFPANLEVGDRLNTPPLPTNGSGCAQSGNTGYRCAVFLSFDEEEEPAKPATLADAISDPAVTVGTQARQPEE